MYFRNGIRLIFEPLGTHALIKFYIWWRNIITHTLSLVCEQVRTDNTC